MLESDMNLLTISSVCGFSDPKYFYKYFEKLYGEKPGAHPKWYSDYIKQPERMTPLDENTAADLLRNLLVAHHMEKTVKY